LAATIVDAATAGVDRAVLDTTVSAPTIPLDGPLFEGRCVRIGWPEAGEFDSITSLRNRPQVRQRFLDPRPLDLERNRDWLAHGMRRPRDALLSIRLAASAAWVGTIGWTGYDPDRRELDVGRIMVDPQAILPHRASLPSGYPGVAVDAGRALRDFVFGRLGLATMTCVVIGDNALSHRTVLMGGMRPVGTSETTRVDGAKVRLINYAMTRDDWIAARGRETAERAS